MRTTSTTSTTSTTADALAELYEQAYQDRHVITYQGRFNSVISSALCDECAADPANHHLLGPVQHGRHWDVCAGHVSRWRVAEDAASQAAGGAS